jgi:hypothetical protein
MSNDAFVNPAKRERWETDHKSVQDADWRDYLQKLIGDAMEATCGL